MTIWALFVSLEREFHVVILELFLIARSVIPEIKAPYCKALENEVFHDNFVLTSTVLTKPVRQLLNTFIQTPAKASNALQD